MTLDELRGHVADVLAISLSDGQTIQALLSRVNGADLNQLLFAALSVARDQVSQKIAELERALDDSEQDRWQLEDEMRELQGQIKHLTEEGKRKNQGQTQMRILPCGSNGAKPRGKAAARRIIRK
jgi:hypothetical protein